MSLAVARRGALALSLALVLLAVVTSSPAQAGQGTVPADRRILVLSVPGLRWNDVDPAVMPTLHALAEQAAVANLATRVTRLVAEPGEAYLTLGTGTRAVVPELLIAPSYDHDEPFAAGTAAEEHSRQHSDGGRPDVVNLAWHQLEAANEAAEYGGSIGGLGQVLADAGIERGVVGNADGTDPLLPAEPLHREVALALADEEGSVPCGEIGTSLLEPAADAPFGVRLDRTAVVEAVDRCSTARSVVLVEASDVRREDAVRDRTEAEHGDARRQAALIAADDLLADLLDGVDAERDAVVVLAPTTAPDKGLGVLAVRAREIPRGLLTSGNTRRAGYVLLTDVAPSIAALAGVEMDEASIEGRAMEVRASDRSVVQVREDLVDGEDAALFRDRLVDPVVLAVVVLTSLLALLTAVALVRRWDALLPWSARAALVLLAIPTTTYLAALLPLHEWGTAAYVAVLAAGSLLHAVVCARLAQTWLGRLALLYGTLVAVVTASVVLLGSRLQVSTVFGDSPVVAGRFLGINNVTFALYVMSAAMLACLVVHARPGADGRRIMVALLGAVLLVDVAPMWGADVGGALAGVPALVLLGVGLGRWQVRWRTLALMAVGTLVLVAVLGALDLSRPPADRSHLGRLLERIGGEGTGGLSTVVERKLSANLRSLTQSTWRYLFAPLAVAAGLVVAGARGRLTAVVRSLPALGWAIPGLLALGLLGYAANDSGVAVPGAMLAAFTPGLVVLIWRARSLEELT